MDIEKIISKMTLEQKVGQLCVPILQKDNITDDLRYFIEERHIGFLRFCPNAEFDNASVIVGEPNKYFSAGEMAEFLNSVQKLAIDTTGVPLFISVDQEGSIRNDVNRDGAFAYSGHMSFGAAGDPELTYKIAKATAKEFRSMGINHVQAPICDVLRYPGRKTMKSSVFAEDQQTVTDHAFAMMKGLQDGGVSSMCKHFPGYGSLATDAHKGVAEITKDLETLEKEDLVPFIKLCTNGVNGIMIGHVVTHCIDDVVATVSPKVIKEYLRGKIGFDGIVMTDAMRMHAIQDIYGTGPASVMAVQAGCDLVLLRGSKEHFDDGYNALLEAAKNGVLSIEDIDASIRRVLTQKQRVGVLDNPYADPAVADATVGCAEHKALSKKLASSSITALKKKIIPLKDEGQKVLAISVEPQKIAAAMDDIQSVNMLPRAVGYDFKNTEEIMLPLEPTDTQIRECVEKARNADLIVYGMCNAILYDEQVKLAEELNKLGKKVVVVAMDSPFDVELIPYFDDVVATYGVANDSMLATMDVICGRKEGDAVPPVTIPNL